MKIRGAVNRLRSNQIRGWVFADEGEGPVRVGLWINGVKFAVKAANRPRADLKQQGIHPTGDVGFNFALPDKQALKAGDQVTLKVIDTGDLLLPRRYAFDGGVRVFLLHIPKTAGSSLNWYFQKALGKDRCVTHVESKRDLIYQRFFYRYSFVSGHMKLPSFRRWDARREFNTITILRDPLEQLISHLRWTKTLRLRPDNFVNATDNVRQMAERLETVDLDDAKALTRYVESMTDTERDLFDNCQVRYLIATPPPILEEQHYADAVAALESMSFVGITEHFQRCVNAMSARYELAPTTKPIRRNVNELMEPALRSAEARAAVGDLLRFDRRLYERGRQLFEEQCAALGV